RIAADGMADGRDRLGITAVVGNRLISDAAPARMSVSACRNTAAIDALRKLVPPPIHGSDQAIEQISPSARMVGRRRLLRWALRNKPCRDQNRRQHGHNNGTQLLGLNHELAEFDD